MDATTKLILKFLHDGGGISLAGSAVSCSLTYQRSVEQESKRSKFWFLRMAESKEEIISHSPRNQMLREDELEGSWKLVPFSLSRSMRSKMSRVSIYFQVPVGSQLLGTTGTFSTSKPASHFFSFIPRIYCWLGYQVEKERLTAAPRLTTRRMVAGVSSFPFL